MKVNYPLKDINEENVETKLGSNNKYGKYPIGDANIWHGGIHLEGDQKELLAIADGRIIAYRLASTDKEGSIDKEIDKEIKFNYSNGFLLLQHDYKSPEGLEMTFYSIYHHILSKDELDSQKAPKFLSITETVVKDVKQQKTKGLRARSKAKHSKIEFVIPKGATVTLDDAGTPETHWSKTGYPTAKYKKVIFTDLQGTIHNDIYIATNSKYVTTDANNAKSLTIKTNDDKGVRAEPGEHLRKTGKSDGEIITVIKKDTVVTSIEKKGEYTKIKYKLDKKPEQEGFIYSDSIENKYSIDTTIKEDKIIACDIKVKAGEHIGYTGKYGTEKNKNYTATHLEIFTTKKIKDFLENTKEDGKDKQHFATVLEGTMLMPTLEVAVNIKENTPIKILKFEGEYAQIEITSITAILYRDTDINDNKAPHNNKGLYTIKDLEKVSKAFNGLVNATTTFTQNQVKRATSKPWDEDLSRKITYYPEDYNKKYWVSKSDVAQIETGLCINDAGNEVMGYQEAAVNDTTKTGNPITTAYIEPPIAGDTTQEEIVNKEHITNLRKFKKVKDNNKETWYKSELTYSIDEKKETKKGWLAEKDIELFSAYDWEKFDFKYLNAGSEFVYSLQDIEKQDITATVDKGKIAPFINTIWEAIWEKIENTENKKISTLNFKLSYDEPEQVEVLSKLVCTHKNEWSYDIETIKAEVQEIYNTAMGKNPSPELQTQVKSRILTLESKMKELLFWQEASGLKYEGEVDNKLPPRAFPSTDMVHYFHPISWVRQMKLILDKPDIDLRPLMTFEAQTGSSDCNITCKRIMKRMGVVAEGAVGEDSILGGKYPQSKYQLANEVETRDGLVFYEESSKEGLAYLDKSLEYGHPVLVGVNHTYQYRGGSGINEGTTDHYVIIVGRKYVEGIQRYIFWDVGTRRGESTEWFFEQDNYKLLAEKTYKSGNKPYTLTQIRRNLDENNQILNY